MKQVRQAIPNAYNVSKQYNSNDSTRMSKTDTIISLLKFNIKVRSKKEILKGAVFVHKAKSDLWKYLE